ncbi:MAG: PqqD family protein [Alphaproteobacteria bacterium]|nr:PqqD family protein [Alphaproteobacteria bacterium]
MDLNEIQRRKNQFATRMVGNEMILVPVTSHVADMTELFTLNEVGSFIWERIDGTLTEAKLVEAIIWEFEVDRETAQNDLSEFLNELQQLMDKDKSPAR